MGNMLDESVTVMSHRRGQKLCQILTHTIAFDLLLFTLMEQSAGMNCEEEKALLADMRGYASTEQETSLRESHRGDLGPWSAETQATTRAMSKKAGYAYLSGRPSGPMSR
jgi:hypothetical protein